MTAAASGRLSIVSAERAHPIIFTADSVRAILAGSKTQTRRVVKLPSHFRDKSVWDSINAKRGFSWESNPWVWEISFRRTS